MSRIYFHAEHRTAEVRGWERSHMDALTSDVALGAVGLLHPGSSGAQRLRDLSSGNATVATLRDGPGWGSWFATLARASSFISGEPLVSWRGHPLDMDTLIANTAMLVGSDVLRLMTRLHNQCEIHCWVDGPDRDWLADLIEQGLQDGLLREGLAAAGPDGTRPGPVNSSGWDSVLVLLREAAEGPVVCSYSVTESFPNAHIAGWHPDMAPYPLPPADSVEDAFEHLNVEDQWAAAMDGLRAAPGNLQLRPDTWTRYRFGDGLSLLDLTAVNSDEILTAALLPTDD